LFIYGGKVVSTGSLFVGAKFHLISTQSILQGVWQIISREELIYAAYADLLIKNCEGGQLLG